MKNIVKKSVIAGALALTVGLAGCAQVAKVPVVGSALAKGSVVMANVFGEESQINFASGSARINEAEAREALEPFVAELSDLPNGGLIKIEGHTDSKGLASTNEKLSLARAESVKRVLVGMGVDPSQIETVGRGEAVAIANNATAQGRAKNRRVKVTLTRL